MNPDVMDVSAFAGVPISTSPYVPEYQVLALDGRGFIVHGRLSHRGKMRRKHGRARPAPRRWKVKTVFYAPMLDRIKEASK